MVKRGCNSLAERVTLSPLWALIRAGASQFMVMLTISSPTKMILVSRFTVQKHIRHIDDVLYLLVSIPEPYIRPQPVA